MNLLQQTIVMKGSKVVSGRSRGRRLGIPTINIDLSCVPKELKHGIYACWIWLNGKKHMGSIHYGLRPVFNDSETFEVHVLDTLIEVAPACVDILIVSRIRDIRNFDGPEGLKSAIAADIQATRAMLQKHEKASEEHHP